jgi:hypothetical protein
MPMLVLYAFCAIPFLMLGVICFAIVGKVREGRYSKSLLGDAPVETPPPAVALALVIGPFLAIIMSAVLTGAIGWIAAAALLAVGAILSRFVYCAAAKRHAEKP